MPWWNVAAQGLGALGGLFGGRHYHDPQINPFSFTPNENDPELALMRRRALMDMQSQHSTNVNELSRAGLLGSSAAFGVLQGGDTQGYRNLEDITSGAFANQRTQALHEYDLANEFKRQKALTDLGQVGHERLAALGSLGDIGQGIGYGTPNIVNDPEYAAYLRRKRAMLTDPYSYETPTYNSYQVPPR